LTDLPCEAKMIKSTSIFLITLLALPLLLLAQKLDSTKNPTTTVPVTQPSSESKPAVKSTELGKANKLDGFVDKNANGIDDRLEKKADKEKGKQMGKGDLFIDKNGDGICDGRESAIGLRKAHSMRKGRGP
jgi:hypothetical protein